MSDRNVSKFESKFLNFFRNFAFFDTIFSEYFIQIVFSHKIETVMLKTRQLHQLLTAQ